MPYRLRDRLHWCQCAGRIVFLDLLEDRYSCLVPDATAAFLRLAGGQAGPDDVRRLRPLILRGMLVEDRTAKPLKGAAIPLASGDFANEPYPPPSLAGLLQAVTEQVRWGFLLRARPLAWIVNRPRPTGTPWPAGQDGSLWVGKIISAFAAVSAFLPSEDRCLVRALAFNALCRRRGMNPSLVFGVRMNPFRAHCWVQLGGQVLIGDFEQVRLFTPIAAFG